MKRYHSITVLSGDGIGPEVMEQALKVLHATSDRFGFTVSTEECLVGGAAIDAKAAHFLKKLSKRVNKPTPSYLAPLADRNGST